MTHTIIVVHYGKNQSWSVLLSDMNYDIIGNERKQSVYITEFRVSVSHKNWDSGIPIRFVITKLYISFHNTHSTVYL